MKLLAGLIFLFLLFSVQAEVTIKGYVTDEANILTPQEESEIQAILEGLHRDGVAQGAVVVIKYLYGREISEYAFSLAEGVLGDKEKNNGLLLLIAIEDHKYRFEVGRGLEEKLNDAKIGRVGRTFLVPAFQKEEYGRGIIESLKGVEGILRGTEEMVVEEEGNSGSWFWYYIIFLGVWMLISIIFRRRKTIRKRNDYFEAALLAASMFRGGRGGGGGLGGFGGGSFSGGGAGGGW